MSPEKQASLENAGSSIWDGIGEATAALVQGTESFGNKLSRQAAEAAKVMEGTRQEAITMTSNGIGHVIDGTKQAGKMVVDTRKTVINAEVAVAEIVVGAAIIGGKATVDGVKHVHQATVDATSNGIGHTVDGAKHMASSIDHAHKSAVRTTVAAMEGTDKFVGQVGKFGKTLAEPITTAWNKAGEQNTDSNRTETVSNKKIGEDISSKITNLKSIKSVSDLQITQLEAILQKATSTQKEAILSATNGGNLNIAKLQVTIGATPQDGIL